MKLMLNGKEVSGMGHYVMAGDIKDATAEDSNVLSGKAYYNNNGKREGTMPNRGGMSAELAAGGSVSIPEGFHDGTGSVRAQDLASQTAGTAAAANIEAGYTAWVNGEMVEGTGKMDILKVVKTFTPVNTNQQQFVMSNTDNALRFWLKTGLCIVVLPKTAIAGTKLYLYDTNSILGYLYNGGNVNALYFFCNQSSKKLTDFFTSIEEVSLA